MTVAVSEIIKDKVFLFLAPDASSEKFASLENFISTWMNSKINTLKAETHTEFKTRTSDGGIAIVSIVDVHKDHQVNQYNISFE